MAVRLYYRAGHLPSRKGGGGERKGKIMGIEDYIAEDETRTAFETLFREKESFRKRTLIVSSARTSNVRTMVMCDVRVKRSLQVSGGTKSHPKSIYGNGERERNREESTSRREITSTRKGSKTDRCVRIFTKSVSSSRTWTMGSV